ncbi:MAG: vanadium-dependent haloperoxidase [Runella sp.]
MKNKGCKIYFLIFCFFFNFIDESNAQVISTKMVKSEQLDASVAIAWAELTVKIITKAPLNTPTYCSRALGYLGLAMYETVVVTSPNHHSIFPLLCDSLRKPKAPKKKDYYPELALSSAQSFLLKSFYGYLNNAKLNFLIDSLEQAVHQKYVSILPKEIIQKSENYGKAVAYSLYEWSKTDGGHEAYKNNFPIDYKWPRGEGIWVAPLVGQSNSKIPLHPHWGSNRTFSKLNSLLPLPPPLEYSSDSLSEYYKFHKEVFERKKTLTPTEHKIVMWWGDDPHESCSPPGHSYNLATIAIKKARPNLIKAAETYAKVGMAVADAFVCCWKAKFTYLVERPSTYVNRFFHDHENEISIWLPFFREPPFPSFYSGHAVQSAATATVLTHQFGDSFSFTDNTHSYRKPITYYVPIPLPPHINRKTYKYSTGNLHYTSYEMHFDGMHYNSFWEAAEQCANSRLLGGIHTRYDNEIGLQQGIKIAENIINLKW